MSQDEKKDGAAKKFARLVTDGPESYREKYAGMSEEEMSAKMEEEMNEKMSRANTRREEKYRDRDARREARLNEKMQRWNREDWGKPIFLRRSVGKHHVFWRVFWGVLFLAAAGLVIATSFGWLSLFSMNIWWLILMIFLFIITIASLIHLNWFGVFFPAAGILTVLNSQNLLVNWNGQMVGGIFATALLLSIAFSILFHHKGYRNWRREIGKHKFDDYSDVSESLDDEKVVAVRANMGEAIKYVNSKNLEKVLIECKLGAVKIYFDNAKIAGKELLVHINCSLGGVEMYVPKTWRVVSGLNAMAGGVSEKNRAELTADSPVVQLSGNANLGGVEIIYV